MSSAPHDTPGVHRRIALILVSLADSGAGGVGIARVRWFAAAGYDVTVVTASPTPAGRPSDLPSSVTHHAMEGPRSLRGKVRRLRELLTEGRFDIVLSVGTGPNLLCVAATRGLAHRPLVVLSELGLVTSGAARPSLAARRRTRQVRRAYRHADVVTSSSHAIGAEISAAFAVPASRSLVVPDPVVPDAIEVPRRQPTTRATAGVQLVLTGALDARARPELAISAAAQLRSRGIDAEVLSLGTGPLHSRVTSFAEQVRVPFTVRADGKWPSRPDSIPVLVLLSRSEGLGAPLVAAAARGIPSVAVSTALGVADAIVPGVTGELAFDDSPASIADAVEAASAIEVTGVEAWLDRFSLDASGALLERAIDYAASRRSIALT